jgi:fibronectin-binding autotransporter adhesin
MHFAVRTARVALVVTAVLALSPAAHGQTFTWVGTATGASPQSWSTASNWAGNTVPAAGSTTDLVFNSILDTTFSASNDLASPFLVRSLTLNNQSSYGASPFGMTVSGTPLQFAATNASIVDNGATDAYIGPFSGGATSVELTGPTTITGSTSSGLLRFYDQITGAGSLIINKPSTNFGNGGVSLFFTSTTAANNYSGGTVLQAGALIIGGGIQTGTTSTVSNIGSGPLTIATTGADLAATGDLRASTTAPTIVPNAVTINAGATLNQKRGTSIVFGGSVNGGGAGAGVYAGSIITPYATNSGFVFEGANNFTGPAQAIQSNMTLRGTNGAFSGSTQINLFRNSVLLLDSNTINPDMGNTAGNQTAQNRIRDDAVVSMHRADFNLTANATAATTETIGTLNGDGWNIFQLTPQATSSATLTINNLVRQNRGTFEFRGPNTGSTATTGIAAPGTAGSGNVILGQINGSAPSAALVGGGAIGSTRISIVPFMTSGPSESVGGTTFLTYDPTNGLRALNTATEFATTLPAAAYLSGATNNVRAAASQVLATPLAAANSLILAGSGVGIYGAGGLVGQLTVTSGAVLAPFSGTANYLNVGQLSFAGREGLISADNPLVINSAVSNNTGLTISGTSRTFLLNPTNVIGGPLTLNGGESGFQGSVTINSQAQLGGATAINFNGGVLAVSNLATGVADTISTPINVGAGGGTINVIPVGASTGGTAQVLNLTGAIIGSGPLFFNGASGNGAGSGGTVILAGDASGFSGPVSVLGGVLQFDSPTRLGSNPILITGNATNLSQASTLHPTASMTLTKDVYFNQNGTTFVQVDAGQLFTMSGVITSVGTAGSLRKFGPGEMLLTAQDTYGSQTFVGTPVINNNVNISTSTGAGVAVSFSGVGGTLTLRDQGALVYTSSVTIAPGSTLVADNTGSSNLSNRINNGATINLAGGSLVLKGATTAASSEIVGPANLAGNTGSIVEVVPGATQTAALFFSGPTTGGLVRTNLSGFGSTLTLRAPGLGGTTAGTGQINFINSASPTTGPTLVGGGGAAGSNSVSILPGVFGEDSASGAIGLTTTDSVPATAGFPQYFRSRLLTASEYTAGLPDAGIGTSNMRITTAVASSANPTVNALHVDVGGSLAITAGSTVTLNSGTMLMAGGTSVTGGALAAASDNDLSIYVGAGTATLGSDVVLTSSNLPATPRTLAKAGPGTLTLTAPLSLTSASVAGALAIQRGTVRLGAGGSLPASTNVVVDAGATFDVNGTGATVNIGRLVGLGTVQLGSNAATVLQVNTPSGFTAIFGGTITGSGTFAKAGVGTFEFGPTANFTGPINYTAGFLQFGDASSLSPIIPVVAGGTITMAAGTDISIIGVQDFQRPINVTAGTAIIDNFSNLGSTTRFSGGITIATGATLNMSTSAVGLYRATGAITGGGNMNWAASVNVIIDGNNNYTGTTTITPASSVVGIGSDTAFGNGGTLTVAGTTSFYAAGGNHTVANPTTFNADVTFGTTLPVYQGLDLTFAGPITLGASRTVTTTGAGRYTLTNVGGAAFNLTKAGGGTLVLAGPSNTYSGTTAVNAGTLLVNGTLAAGGAVTVAGGAVLGGSGTINRDVSVSALGAISPGLLTVNGNLTLAATSAYVWELGANTTAGPGTNWDEINMTSGALAVLTGAQLVPSFVGTATLPNAGDAFWQSPEQWNNVIALSGGATNPSGAAAFVIDNSAWSSAGLFSTTPATGGSGVTLVWTPTAVPEPGSMALLLGAAGSALGLRRFRRRARTTT